MVTRAYPLLSKAQERMLRRLGLTPGHVEACPQFRDGGEKFRWKRTVKALYKKGLIEVQKDYALDELFVQLSVKGLRYAKLRYGETGLTPKESEALHQLRDWRKALKTPPPVEVVRVPMPLPVVCPPARSPCSGGRWHCTARHSAKTREGLARARQQGVRIGRPRAVIPEDQVLAMHARGISIRAIGKTVGLGAATVHRFLDAYRRAQLAEGGGNNTGVVYPGTRCASLSPGIRSRAGIGP